MRAINQHWQGYERDPGPPLPCAIHISPATSQPCTANTPANAPATLLYHGDNVADVDPVVQQRCEMQLAGAVRSRQTCKRDMTIGLGWRRCAAVPTADILPRCDTITLSYGDSTCSPHLLHVVATFLWWRLAELHTCAVCDLVRLAQLQLLLSGPDGSFGWAATRNIKRIPAGVCNRGCEYAMLQSVQKHWLCNAI